MEGEADRAAGIVRDAVVDAVERAAEQADRAADAAREASEHADRAEAAKKHEHTNKEEVLDKLSFRDGALLFDGNRINDGLVDVAFSSSIDSIPANLRDGGLLIVGAGA